MTKRERSRQEWEQEIVRRQQNITPAQYPEGLHYARIAGLPRIVSQWRFWLGIALIAVAVILFGSKPSAGLAVAALAAGLLLAITAMGWKDSRK